MWTSPMKLKWLLMWLLFGFIKGEQPGLAIPREELLMTELMNAGRTFTNVEAPVKCPQLPRTEFADVTAEMYPRGTKLYYKCDPGYDRNAGVYAGIECKKEEQGAVWNYQQFKCNDMKKLLSTAPTMELELTQKPEREPQRQEDFSESKQKDFCGPPKAIPHASIGLPKQYYVGQVLHFKCQAGYDKRPPTFGNRTCKKENEKIFWTPLDMICTNDSSQWPTQTVGTGLTLLSSSSSSEAQPVTAIWFVLLIIPTAFM